MLLYPEGKVKDREIEERHARKHTSVDLFFLVG